MNLLRSLFFVPGHVSKYLQKAKTLESDAIILDLEDSVPEDAKEDALQKVSAFIRNNNDLKSKIIIRINPIESGRLIQELSELVCDQVFAIMPAKVETVEDIQLIDGILKQLELSNGIEVGSILLLPLIESLNAFIYVSNIAKASNRMVGLAFGGEDYLQELGGFHGVGDHTFDYPRTKIAIAAKAAGLQAFDTPFLDVSNHEGFLEREQKSRDLGYEGCLIIHPSQIEYAHTCFSPSDQEVKEAEDVLKAVVTSRENGLSVVLKDGVLVGPPMLKKAEKIIAKMKMINDKK